ncbi:MAG: hypothetical protein ABFS86_17420 [Planctomycetota bacterium]
MSMSAEFSKSPEAFLKKHTLHTGGRLAGSGNKKVGFTMKSGTLFLEEDPKGVKCYYLKTAKGMTNTSCLDRAEKDARFFFTDSLTGCQFLAHGGSINPTVEHDNAPGGFSNRLAQATKKNLLCSVVPGKDYADDEIANVVGVKSGKLWEFYLQHGAPGKPRVRKLA